MNRSDNGRRAGRWFRGGKLLRAAEWLRSGEWLRSVAARIVSAHTMEQVVDPAVADLRHEYHDALRRHRVWRARWILLAGHVAILKVIALDRVGQLVRAAAAALGVSAAGDGPASGGAVVATVAGLGGEPPETRPRVFAGATCALFVTAGVTLLFQIPVLASVWSAPGAHRLMLAIYAAPQALAIAVPVGFVLGIVYGFGASTAARSVSRASVRQVLVAAVVCSALSFVSIEWLVPLANREFRVLAAGHFVGYGANELTFGELRGRVMAMSDADARNALAGRSDRRTLATVFYSRESFSVAPLVLSLFLLWMLHWRTFARMALAFAACVVYVGYFFWLTRDVAYGHVTMLSPFVAAWLPNALVIYAAIVAMMMAAPWRAHQPPTPAP